MLHPFGWGQARSSGEPVRFRRRAPLLAVVMLLAPIAGCGYTLVGQGAFLPDYIRVVAIPTFVNQTPRFELEVRLTDAVTREFVSRGNYRVVGQRQGADAVLEGTIQSFEVRPIGVGQQENADTWQVTVRARVTFTDLVANKVLFTNSAFLYQNQFEFPDSSLGRIDIEVSSIDEIAGEFARAVVSAILEGF
jgi:hypothetical protein